MADVTCELVGLYPTAQELTPPEEGHSYVVYDVSGFSESGIHGFIRTVPAIGVAMAKSNFPLDKVDLFSNLLKVIINDLNTGGSITTYMNVLPYLLQLAHQALKK